MFRLIVLAVVVAAALLFLPGGTLLVGYTLAALSLGLIVFLLARAAWVAVDHWRLGRFPSSTSSKERSGDSERRREAA